MPGRRPLLPFFLFLLIQCAAPAHGDPGDALDTGGSGAPARYVLRAEERLGHGRISDSLALTQRAITLLPDFVLARLVSGAAYMAAGRYEEALAEFNHVVAAHPEYPGVFAARGLADLRAGRAREAIEDMNRALTTPRGMGDQLASVIFLYRSLAFQLLGQDQAAIADFQRGLDPLPGQIDDYDSLALDCYTAAVIGLLDTAQLACDESINRHARNLIAYEARGLADLKQGALDRAIADDTQMLYYRSDQPFALYGRGLAKSMKGDAQGGAADMRAAIALEPDIAQIMGRLGVKGTSGSGKRP